MTQLDEFNIRLSDILEGPWRGKVMLARKHFSSDTNFTELASSTQVVSVQRIQSMLTQEDREREEDLLWLLRPHWVAGIRSKHEITLRDAFDETLDLLQLIELGIETGYLDVDVSHNVARKELLSLLWSRGARQFVQTYEYIAVHFLAHRVGVDLGMNWSSPPSPDARAEVRFATFLAEHVSWAIDLHLNRWLRLMDDYGWRAGSVIRVDGLLFREYLKTGKLPVQNAQVEKLLLGLATGMARFIAYLGGLFAILETHERPYFALFYSYWIARFFGYRLNHKGYVKVGADWSTTIDGLVPIFVALYGEDKDSYQYSIEKDIASIRIAWKETVDLISRTTK